MDPSTDLALLRAEAGGLKPLAWQDDAELSVGRFFDAGHDMNADKVAILLSLDGGENWTEIARNVYPEDFMDESEKLKSEYTPNPESARVKVEKHYKAASLKA